MAKNIGQQFGLDVETDSIGSRRCCREEEWRIYFIFTLTVVVAEAGDEQRGEGLECERDQD